jgi:hypothetical protein
MLVVDKTSQIYPMMKQRRALKPSVSFRAY